MTKRLRIRSYRFFLPFLIQFSFFRRIQKSANYTGCYDIHTQRRQFERNDKSSGIKNCERGGGWRGKAPFVKLYEQNSRFDGKVECLIPFVNSLVMGCFLCLFRGNRGFWRTIRNVLEHCYKLLGSLSVCAASNRPSVCLNELFGLVLDVNASSDSKLDYRLEDTLRERERDKCIQELTVNHAMVLSS
jgi:hypothetical protein